jgi:hypothetical protein
VNRKIRFAGILLALLSLFGAASVLAAGQDAPKSDPPAAAAGDNADKDQGVTFNNRSRDTQHVLAVFDGEKCEEMKQRSQLQVEPGQSATVDSGEHQVCWCASTLGKVGNCTVWSKAKAGKTVTIR